MESRRCTMWPGALANHHVVERDVVPGVGRFVRIFEVGLQQDTLLGAELAGKDRVQRREQAVGRDLCVKSRARLTDNTGTCSGATTCTE